MKYLFATINIFCVATLIILTLNGVRSGDVCRTIFGCFVLWCWFYEKNR